MDLSIFLAKLFGLYMLTIGSIWIVRKKTFETYLNDFFASKGLILFSGLISLLLGLSIAISHSLWQLDWIGLVTLLGYIAIVKGIVRCAYPEKAKKWAHQLIQKAHFWLPIFLIALGGYLTYSGFST